MAAPAVYWRSRVPTVDYFHNPITTEFIDGRTPNGQWTLMAPASWLEHGCGTIGLGSGQRYQLQNDNRWLKVEG